MKGMAIIMTVVGIAAGTVSAEPVYNWSSVDLGNGLHGYSFWCDNQDWPATPWFVEMEWHGASGSEMVLLPGTLINQVQAYGSFDVHLEVKADGHDAAYPASGYRQSQDSWIRAEFSHAVMEVVEGPNRYYVESGTALGVFDVTVPHAYIVCDGDVAFSGRLAAYVGEEAPIPAWTEVSGVAYPKPAPEFYAVLAGSEDGWIRGDQDAAALRDVLLNYGGVNPENIKLELNPLNLSATIQEVRDKLEPGDTFLLYFSGHGGYRLGDGSEPEEPHSALAVSSGAGLSNTDDEVMYFNSDSLGLHGQVVDDTLTAWLEGIPDVHKIVLMDSCFSGGFWGSLGNSTDQGDLDKLENVGLLASCPSGDVSFSMPGTGRSFFSIALERALDPGPGGIPPADANGDGRVSFGELGAYMEATYVVEELGDTGIIQGFPWLDQPVEAQVDSLELYTIYGTGFDPHAAIPEPAGLLLIALGALALLRRRTAQVIRRNR